jgi:hypothetical protein
MGYYTTYALSILKNNDENIDHEQNICDIAEYDGIFQESVKWYEHEEDMKKYSLQHPTVLFDLSGEGEETGDLWVKYFLNGKVQTCQAVVTYEDFNPEKLV